ncbi:MULTISPECIES: hypothetical protein [Streptomyces]|nr:MULTISPECIES: hypothetical protein [unclassified Streptomyces]
MDTISKQYQDDSDRQYRDSVRRQDEEGSKLYQDGYEGGGAPWES